MDAVQGWQPGPGLWVAEKKKYDPSWKNKCKKIPAECSRKSERKQVCTCLCLGTSCKTVFSPCSKDLCFTDHSPHPELGKLYQTLWRAKLYLGCPGWCLGANAKLNYTCNGNGGRRVNQRVRREYASLLKSIPETQLSRTHSPSLSTRIGVAKLII